MSGHKHTVVDGEFLAKIARAEGFAESKTIWDAPENKGLKTKRKNPNVLNPGEEVFIPEKETKEESRATEKKHRFELQNEKLMLRIRLLGFDKKPLDGHECTLRVEGEPEDLTTKPDGQVEK